MPDASLDKPPLPTRLADYRPPDFLIDEVALDFDLGDTETLVKSHLQLRRNPEAATPAAPLRLDGEELALLAISLDGKPLAPGDYALEPDGTLAIPRTPDAFSLDITAHIHPETNTQLSGLYMSGGNYCTQCEPEGFRRITWFLDRPDVMSRFTVTVRGDKSRYPVLLSNGNPSGSGDLADGRHFAKWIDPHPKPSYLFALVAGDLVAVRDNFTTRSGRTVPLAIWVRRGDEDKCGHAMASLKKSMRWDEETFGLEYDLDVYNIGAEVIRMLHTLLGADGFRHGMDAYIANNDNHAATIEDFLAAMEEGNGVDLSHFRLWYRQAGTPEIAVEDHYDPATRQYELTVSQRIPPTPGQPDKQPMPVPLAMGLLGPNGDEMPTRLDGESDAKSGTRVLLCERERQVFRFADVAAPPVL